MRAVSPEKPRTYSSTRRPLRPRPIGGRSDRPETRGCKKMVNAIPVLDAIGDDVTLNSEETLSAFEAAARNAGVGRMPGCAGAYRFPRSINPTGVRLIGDDKNASKIRIISSVPVASIYCGAASPGGPETSLEDFGILMPLKPDGSPATGDG